MKPHHPNTTDLPDGSEALQALFQRLSPSLTPDQIAPLALALLGYPDLTGQALAKAGAVQVLTDEAAVVAMLVQAWSLRAEAALPAVVDLPAPQRRHPYLPAPQHPAVTTGRAVSVIANSLRYLPGSRRLSEGGVL